MIVWINGTHGSGCSGFADHDIPLRHFVLHADPATLRSRITGDAVMGPSSFRLRYLDAYADAAQTWLHDAAEVIDTSHRDPRSAARSIASAVS